VGAWGTESFENDAALDWLVDLAEGEPAQFRDALALVRGAEPDDYVDADDAFAALAAAELVAAARTGKNERLPDDAARWLADHAGVIRPDDAALARAAIERVLAGSELGDLWFEGNAEPWRATVAELLRRLA
jgi:hypothetical protein